MIRVEICLGNTCYTSGSRDVLKELEKKTEENGWQDKVELLGTFCMKACSEHLGMGVRVNGKKLEGITASNAVKTITEEINKELAEN